MSFLIPEASRELAFSLSLQLLVLETLFFFFLVKTEGQNEPMTLNSKTLTPKDEEMSRKTEQDRNARKLQQKSNRKYCK